MICQLKCTRYQANQKIFFFIFAFCLQTFFNIFSMESAEGDLLDYTDMVSVNECLFCKILLFLKFFIIWDFINKFHWDITIHTQTIFLDFFFTLSVFTRENQVQGTTNEISPCFDIFYKNKTKKRQKLFYSCKIFIRLPFFI